MLQCHTAEGSSLRSWTAWLSPSQNALSSRWRRFLAIHLSSGPFLLALLPTQLTRPLGGFITRLADQTLSSLWATSDHVSRKRPPGMLGIVCDRVLTWRFEKMIYDTSCLLTHVSKLVTQ